MENQGIQENDNENYLLGKQEAGMETNVEESINADIPEEPTYRSRKKKKGNGKKRGRNAFFLHFLQHVSLITGAALFAAVFAGSYMVVDTRKGTVHYNLAEEDRGSSFEDSGLFNSLLGNSVTDIICYGAIRGQMETGAKFDAGKKIDVTAFANRYNGIWSEYITAEYYLDDLLKWAQAGFDYEEVYMSGEDVERFLSTSRIVTKVDLENLGGGTISCLNSDLSSVTKVEDISGNLLGGEGTGRDAVQANVLKNRYRTAEGKNIEDYVSTWEEYYELCSNIKKAAEDLNTNYNEYLNYRDYYDSGNSNVVYFIRRTIGDKVQIFSNMESQSQTTAELKKELEEKCGRYIFYDAHAMQFETNTLIEESTLRYILNGYDYAYPDDTQVMIGIIRGYDAPGGADDCFSQAKAGFGNYVPYVWQYLSVAVICMLVYLFLLMMLTIWEGRNIRKTSGKVIAGLLREDYIPTEIMVLAACITAYVLYWGISGVIHIVWRSAQGGAVILLAAMAALFVSLCFSFFYYSFVRRVKAKILWRESLIRRFGLSAKRWILYGYDHSALILRVWVPFVLFVVFNLVGMAFTVLLTDGFSGAAVTAVGLLILLSGDGAVGYFLYRSSLSRQLILEGIQLISEGNLGHKVKEEGMHGDELVLARAVNSIGDSVRAAVETSMKDERMKADLITNVSHDIKTPLTSIINYVDLIKRENVENPKIREYIEVLDTKSQRLKQLTDDLVEASKISSGNIVLQWEKIDLVQLLHQTVGEFSEKFEEKALYLIFHAPKGNVYIKADSRRIWRVIENLFNNIFKYALAGTRVYIDMGFAKKEENQKWVVLSIKNISAQPLKVSPKELTERFIRGDESRTTEGSGLGLSIAKNLTEALKGEFEIVMDGDLFKVNLAFPVMTESDAPETVTNSEI